MDDVLERCAAIQAGLVFVPSANVRRAGGATLVGVAAGLVEVVRVLGRIRHSARAHAELPSPRAAEVAAALATAAQALDRLASAASQANVRAHLAAQCWVMRARLTVFRRRAGMPPTYSCRGTSTCRPGRRRTS